MTEFEQARALAERVLDKPYIDPDGDICMLARQFNRAVERLEKTTAEREAVLQKGIELAADKQRMAVALKSISHGPLTPPPDPGARSWQAWARFWHQQTDRLRVIAMKALETGPNHARADGDTDGR